MEIACRNHCVLPMNPRKKMASDYIELILIYCNLQIQEKQRQIEFKVSFIASP